MSASGQAGKARVGDRAFEGRAHLAAVEALAQPAEDGIDRLEVAGHHGRRVGHGGIKSAVGKVAALEHRLGEERHQGPAVVARVEGCAIEANVGPGIELVGGSLVLQGGAIRHNAGDGLAIATTCHATDVVIADNRGFGVQEAPGATLQLANASIFGNMRGNRS